MDIKLEPNPPTQPAAFDGWAILEIFGHQKYAGYVTTQVFGTACMFRLDVPALSQRERISKSGGYTSEGGWFPAGSKVKDGPTQGYSKVFGVGAIYCITPCTEEAALKAVEELQSRLLMLVSVPPEAPIPLITDDLDVQDESDFP